MSLELVHFSPFLAPRAAAARYLIRESEVGDIYALAKNLRDGDRLEIASLGKEPKAALRNCYRNAILRRTVVVDGEIAAMWGLCGTMLSDYGEPFLLTTPAIERIPVSFLREGRREIARMLRLRRVLVVRCAAAYTQACRFLECLGFVRDCSAHLGVNGELFHEYRMERR